VKLCDLTANEVPSLGIIPPEIVPSAVRPDNEELGIFSSNFFVLSKTPVTSVRSRRRSALHFGTKW
jgi:hypothetical protein